MNATFYLDSLLNYDFFPRRIRLPVKFRAISWFRKAVLHAGLYGIINTAKSKSESSSSFNLNDIPLIQ